MTRWLLLYLAHSTVIALCAVILSRQRRSVSDAEAIWRAAIVVPFLSATAAWWDLGFWQVNALSPVAAGDDVQMPAVHSQAWFTTEQLLLAGWLTIGGLLVARDVIARRWFISRINPRTTASARIAEALGRLCRQAGVTRAIRLTTSAALRTPIAIGTREICVPARTCASLSDVELDALLAHELRHLLRRDNWWMAFVAAVESLFFIQPLHRVARRELHRLAECDCDGWAAEQIGDREVMAACLIEVAEWNQGVRPVGIAAMASGGLRARVERLLADDAVADRRLGRTRAGCAAAVLAIAVALPSVSARQQPPAPPPAVTPPASPSVEEVEPVRKEVAARKAAASQPRPKPAQPSAEWLAGFEAARKYRAEQESGAPGIGADRAALERSMNGPR